MFCRATVFLSIVFATSTLAQQRSAARTDRFERVYREARGAVVSVVTRDLHARELAQGSGFIVSSDCKIVTNLHVLEGAVTAEVRFPNGDRTTLRGAVASDPANDLAILKGDCHPIHFLKLTDSTKASVGEEVLAIGSPLSLDSTATSGIISAIRNINGTEVVQTSASISPGSSGGPLLNLAGEVVGVTAFQLKNAQNLNFAVAVRHVRPLLRSGDLTPFPQPPPLHTQPQAESKYDESRMGEDQAQIDSILKKVNSVGTAAEKVQILRRALQDTELSMAPRASVELLLGAEYTALGKPNDALSSYEGALQDSLDAGVHILGLYRRLCDAYVYFHRKYEALDMCKAAVAEAKTQDPSDPQTNLASSLTLLGRAYRDLGRFQEAIDAYRAALSIEPGDSMANRDLLALARTRGDHALIKQLGERLKTVNEALWRELFP